ncbi:MAG: XRE family transcriptional regulator [Sulfuritalea sp.]|nr:XRE family transcriptional regulator [Sulfuritalea sp.]
MTRGSGNVFADLGFDAEEAQNLQLRSQAMMAVESWYKAGGLTQAKAAQSLGITQPRLNQLLKGKIGEFSLDALVNMATRAGMRIVQRVKSQCWRRPEGSAAQGGGPSADARHPLYFVEIFNNRSRPCLPSISACRTTSRRNSTRSSPGRTRAPSSPN